MLSSGMTIEETCHIIKSDLDFELERVRITIKHEYTKKNRGRIVYISKEAYKALKALIKKKGPNDFVFLSSIIHAFVEELFRGVEITGCFQFRVTRNSDLYVDPEEIDDLKRALEGELIASRYGAAVRLEIARPPPRSTTSRSPATPIARSATPTRPWASPPTKSRCWSRWIASHRTSPRE